MTKSIAVMQPYFFPYVGYFQLIKEVDHFVVLDDVQYIKGGWINRNRILVNRNPAWLTVPINQSQQSNTKILDREYAFDDKFFRTASQTLATNYSNSDSLDFGLSVFAQMEAHSDMNVADINILLLLKVCENLGLSHLQISRSSSLGLSSELRGQERIIQICQTLGANRYVNLPGGRGLYSGAKFDNHGVELLFLSPNLFPYRQKSEVFVPGLSVLDFILNEGEGSKALFGKAEVDLVPAR